jgi:hypothetical protein
VPLLQVFPRQSKWFGGLNALLCVKEAGCGTFPTEQKEIGGESGVYIIVFDPDLLEISDLSVSH